MRRRSVVRLGGAVVLAAGLAVVCQPQPVRAADEVIDPAVKKLMIGLQDLSRSPADRLAIAKKLGTFGEDKGKPAARALCNAAVGGGALRSACLDSLEKVYPKLYPEISTIMSDTQYFNHYMAIGVIARMGEDANAATPVIATHLKFHAAKPSSTHHVLESYLTWESKEYMPIPSLRRLVGLKGKGVDGELRSFGWIGDYYYHSTLASIDMLTLARIAPHEKFAVNAIADQLSHKNNLVRFSCLVALDLSDLAVVAPHQKMIKKHKEDTTKAVRELAVEMDKKIEAFLTTKQLESKKEEKKP